MKLLRFSAIAALLLLAGSAAASTLSYSYRVNAKGVSAPAPLAAPAVAGTTWDPSRTTGNTPVGFANGDTRVHLAGAGTPLQAVLGTKAHSTGKYYVEFKFADAASLNNYALLGIATRLPPNGSVVWDATYAWYTPGYITGVTGWTSTDSTLCPNSPTMTESDVLSMAVDFDTHSIRFTKNGNWASYPSCVFPIAAGSYYPMASIGSSAASFFYTVDGFFTAASQKFAPPADGKVYERNW